MFERAAQEILMDSTLYPDLESAVRAAGAETRILVLRRDLPCGAAVVVPVTLRIQAAGGAQLVDAGDCSIAFAGSALVEPLADAPLFDQSFDGRELSWKGNYPALVSADLFEPSRPGSLTDKLNRTGAAFRSEKITIYIYRGEITGRYVGTRHHNLIFTNNEYPNRADTFPHPQFDLDSFQSVTCEPGGTIYESAVRPARGISNVRLFGTQSEFAREAYERSLTGATPYVERVTFSGCHIRESPNSAQAYDSSAGAINLYNCHDCRAIGNRIERTHGFGIYAGGQSSANADFTRAQIAAGVPGTGGNPVFASNVTIAGNTIVCAGSQNIGTVNAAGVHIVDNKLMQIACRSDSASIVAIDNEPNMATDKNEAAIIRGNLLDGRGARVAWGGIVHQGAGNNTSRAVQISDNLIIGTNSDTQDDYLASRLTVGISIVSVSNATIADNQILGAGQAALVTDNSARFLVAGNQITGTGWADGKAAQITASVDFVYSRNVYHRVRDKSGADSVHTFSINEYDYTYPVNTAGTVVTRRGGEAFMPHYVGRQVVINGKPVFVREVRDQETMVVDADLGRQSGAALQTRFNEGRYLDNQVKNGIKKTPASTSTVVAGAVPY